MSRAFVKENDGWEFCQKMQDTCWFAKEDGSCPLQKCIHEKEDVKEPKAPDSEQKSTGGQA